MAILEIQPSLCFIAEDKKFLKHAIGQDGFSTDVTMCLLMPIGCRLQPAIE